MVFKHHIGLQVVAEDWDGEKDLRGLTGVLRTLTEDGVHALVEYPMNVSGTDGMDQQGNKVGKAGHCYWLKVTFLKRHGSHARMAKEVQEDYEHRGKNLRGMPFKLIGTMSSGRHVVIEFKEDIGGHSADGRGKTGQCLCVPIEAVQRDKDVPDKKKQTKSKKAGKN